MTILCKPEVGMIIEVNVIYALNTKSQGSTMASDLPVKKQGLHNFLMLAFKSRGWLNP